MSFQKTENLQFANCKYRTNSLRYFLLTMDWEGRLG